MITYTNVHGEFLVKDLLHHGKHPLGITFLKDEYSITLRGKRVDVLAKDNNGMVVVEIKADSAPANLQALHQVMDYKNLIQAKFNQPTRAIILANVFSRELIKYESAILRFYGICEYFDKEANRYRALITKPTVKKGSKVVVISPLLLPDMRPGDENGHKLIYQFSMDDPVKAFCHTS